MARRGELHRVSVADKQRTAQFLFERFDPGGYRRLRKIEFFGGAAEIMHMSQFDKGFNFTVVHAAALPHTSEIISTVSFGMKTVTELKPSFAE